MWLRQAKDRVTVLSGDHPGGWGGASSLGQAGGVGREALSSKSEPQSCLDSRPHVGRGIELLTHQMSKGAGSQTSTTGRVCALVLLPIITP